MRLDPNLLELAQEETQDGRPRWFIVRRNEEARDLYLLKFHPVVPKATAEAVLHMLRKDAVLLRGLK